MASLVMGFAVVGLIARQAGAPVADGETSNGTEMEAEFDTIFTEINGVLANVNIAMGADILGSKLSLGSLAAAKVAANAVTGAKVAMGAVTAEEMAAAAVTQAYVDSDTGTETTTTSGSFVDIPGITDWTVTPGSTSNFIQLEFICYCTAGATALSYEFGFSIDGSPTAILGTFDISVGTPQGWYISWLTTAASASSQVIKPQYGRASGSTTTAFSTSDVEITKLFRGMIIPV